MPRADQIWTPGDPEYWCVILRRVKVQRAEFKRPCDYGPWTQALEALDVSPFALMMFAHALARPGWPADAARQIEFALTFLEKDVMLFQSGYCKRHLLKRLHQAQLNAAQSDRLVALVKRAVIDGAGLEEFRGYGRCAATLNRSDLNAWLLETAQGAVVPLWELPPDTRHAVLEANPNVVKKYVGRTTGYEFGISVDTLDGPVAFAGLGVERRVKANAWRILQVVRRKHRGTP
ncbi:hypothetical protein [Algirhabdus cladophorae]|uniref:hypothetical protein n=1 Tax=Algirhabdus cladophorae TaxID=3377108 RepID=UPI003B84886C